jgi:hypothetical protein
MEVRKKIPSELKRQILIESGHRCAIPQCRHSSNIDIHHIIPWSECKEHTFDNLIALCPNCHRLVHDGKIDKKSLSIYKKNLINIVSQENNSNNKENLSLDKKTFERLKNVIPLSLYSKFKLSAFGDHRTMEILQPFYDFQDLCNDPTFVFSNLEFEKAKNNLKNSITRAIQYINPYLVRDNNNCIRIGPTEGSLGSIEEMNNWSNILDKAIYMIFDILDEYNLLISNITKKLI